MILFNDRFLFIHNPKTAGTSLIEYLSKTLHEPIYTAGVNELGTYHPSLSLALGYAAAKTGTTPDRFKKILAVTRNPYDREVSMYFYFRDLVAINPAFRHDVNDARIVEAILKAGTLTFTAYLAWLRKTRLTCDIWDSKYYYDLQGGRIPEVLQVVRMEDLHWQLKHVMADFIRPGAEAVQLRHLNTTKHEPFATYYDKTAEEIVFNSYHWLFDNVRYERLAGHEAKTKPGSLAASFLRSAAELVRTDRGKIRHMIPGLRSAHSGHS